jgi:hypothetical protein
MTGNAGAEVSQVRFTLTGSAAGELVRLAGKLHGEAQRCAVAGCWRAALILVGGALEAGITATACCLEPELREQGLWPRGDPSRWSLGQVTKLAVSAGWLPTGETGEGLPGKLAGEVGDAIEFLAAVRNMATHPTAVTRHELAPDFADVSHMQVTYELVEGVMAAVFERLDGVIRSAPPARNVLRSGGQ